MKKYIKTNYDYWSQGYPAENVESWIFRFYGRYLKRRSNLSRLLDYGCGRGAALAFFLSKDLDAYGVDISIVDINNFKEKYSRWENRISYIDPEPSLSDRWYGGNFDIVIASESLFYLSDTDLEIRLKTIDDQLSNEGVFFATMLDPSTWYFLNSEPYEDGLRMVKLNKRQGDNYVFINFKNKKETLLLFSKFFNVDSIGFFSMSLLPDEGTEYHHIVVCSKK